MGSGLLSCPIHCLFALGLRQLSVCGVSVLRTATGIAGFLRVVVGVLVAAVVPPRAVVGGTEVARVPPRLA